MATSLKRRVLTQVAVRVGVIIVLLTAAAHHFLQKRLTDAAIERLAEYVRERAARESQIFLLAESNVNALKRAYVDALQTAAGDPRAQFEQKFARSPDGAIRNRPAYATPKLEAGAFVRGNVTLNDEVRRRLLIQQDLATRYGRAWANTFANTYLASMDGLFATFFPGADWAAASPPDLDFASLPWVVVNLPANNPQRKTVWTAIYYDEVAQKAGAGGVFFATVVAPIDEAGEFRHYAGIDVAIDAIVKRTMDSGMQGAYNVIVRDDGQLIAHPQLMQAIEAKQGGFNVARDGDAHLQSLLRTILTARGDVPVVEHRGYDEYLGTARIDGPEWRFVTVFPKALVTVAARRAAGFVLGLGLFSLLLELLVFYWVLRRQVVEPLEELTHATEAVAQGSESTKLALGKNDEFGRMARSFNTMVEAVAARDAALSQHAVNLEIEVERRTAELQTAKDAAEATSRTDQLTGLPNRNLFHDRLAHALDKAERSREPMAVLFVDLDNFKLINDTLGHDAGDAFLIERAQRMRHCVRHADTLARFGGDEFVLLLEGADAATAASQAQRLSDTLAGPATVAGQEIVSTCSIGISVYPDDGADGTTLLKHADMALYRAKERGKNTYCFFTADMNQRAAERFEIEASLRRGLERGEFWLAYQPQVDLASGAVIGLEALLRWRHPQRGVLAPGQFIPIAEATGLIVPLGDWILAQVCAQLRDWSSGELGDLPVSINLSVRQFERGALAATVAEQLRIAKVEPKRLAVEVVENILIEDAEAAIRSLQALRELGVGILLDDFGTGYSSLSYLKRFPVDKIKIDRSLIRDVSNDPDDAAIAAAIVGMGHSLRLDVIAEGVETIGQVEFLKSWGCAAAQGHYFCPPLPADEVLQYVRSTPRAIAQPALTRPA